MKLIGVARLTGDPELKTTNSGIAVCNFSVAYDVGFGDNKVTEFVNCVAWRRPGEIIAEHFKKGDRIYIEASPRSRKYSITKENVEFEVKTTEYHIENFEFCNSSKGTRAQEGTNQNSEVAATEDPF